MNQNLRRTLPVTAIIAFCGLACPAFGQDSVSNNPGVWGAVGGDALRQHNTSEQGNAYIVDLTSLVSSWSHEWGIGVLAKTSRVGAAPNDFFNTIMSNSALSPDFRIGVNRTTTSYRLWTFADPPSIAPGVNATANTAEHTLVAGPASSMQLGWGFSEFGGNENNDVIGGTVAWNASNNSGRLYVNRIVAAVNNSADDVAGSSDPSLGSVDADSNLYVRADRELVTGSQFPLTGANLFRFDAEARNLTKINWLNSQLAAGTSTGTNDTAATNSIALAYGFNFLPPSNIPETLGKRVVTTTSFDPAGDFYVFENPANTPNYVLEAHIDGPRVMAGGLRGSTRVVPISWFGGAVATGAQMIKPQPGSNFNGSIVNNSGSDTYGIGVWGIDSNGAVVAGSQRTYALPWSFTVPGPAIVDNAPGASGQNPATGLPYQVPSLSEFDNYRGTAAFRGPASQVAIGQDLQGNKYIAGVVYNPPGDGTRSAPGNAVVVGKISTASAPGTVTWSVAAWNNYDGSVNGTAGKPILDGPGGNVIGRMVPYEVAETLNLRGGFSTGSFGPSISCAGFDSAGNLYFQTTIQLKRGAQFDDFFTPELPLLDDGFGNVVLPNPERDIYELGLIRAVLNPATFTYDLELVLRTGQVFLGGNTGIEYMLESMTMVNNNNGGPAPSQFDSGNITLASRNNVVPSDNASADALGGLIVQAKVVYNNDGNDLVTPENSAEGNGYASDYTVALGGNGAFEDSSLGIDSQLFAGSTDEAYTVVMFVGNEPFETPTGACCTGPTCTDNVTAENCVLLFDGVYQGDGVLCSSNPCVPVGACCFSCNGTVVAPCPDPSGPVIACTILTQAQCLAARGLYVGNNTTCTQGVGGPCDCAGDINGDGNTNTSDFNILAGQFGQGNPSCRTHAQGDLNCDGVVNTSDFNILAGNFGCIRN